MSPISIVGASSSGQFAQAFPQAHFPFVRNEDTQLGEFKRYGSHARSISPGVRGKLFRSLIVAVQKGTIFNSHSNEVYVLYVIPDRKRLTFAAYYMDYKSETDMKFDPMHTFEAHSRWSLDAGEWIEDPYTTEVVVSFGIDCLRSTTRNSHRPVKRACTVILWRSCN